MKKKIDYINRIKTTSFYIFGISLISLILNRFLQVTQVIQTETRMIEGKEYQIPIFSEVMYRILDITSNINIWGLIIAFILFVAYIIVVVMKYFYKKSK